MGGTLFVYVYFGIFKIACTFTSNTISSTKPLQELNLIDAFLFAVATENVQDAEFIAKLIIERATDEKVVPIRRR